MVRENGADAYHYVYTDHLGSILTITNSSGSVEVEQNFDAWGRRRHPTRWDYISVPTPPDWLYRGFTGHEMLDPFVLINMNGRIYDPVVARVLSPDNFVADPFSTQDFNRYSYGYNNPLKYTDPDGNNPLLGALIGGLGYFLSVAFSKNGFDNWNWGQFASSVALGALTGGIGTELATATASLGPVASGAISGAVSGAVAGGFGSAFAGGDLGRGAWQGGLFGAATGAGIGLLTTSPQDIKLYPGDLLADGGPGPVAYTKRLPPVTIRAPWWQRLGSGLRGSLLSSASIIASLPFIVEGDVSQTQRKSNNYLMYRNMSEGEYNSFMRKGMNFGTGNNTLDVKEFWLTPDGLEYWNSTPFSGPYNVIISVPSRIIGPYGLVQPQVLDGHLAGVVKPINLNIFNKVKKIVSVTKK